VVAMDRFKSDMASFSMAEIEASVYLMLFREV
jgi:hypothetical protein